MSEVWERVVDFVYPKECVGCGELGEWLCSKCRLKFEEVAQICPVCGKNNLSGVVHKKCSKCLGLDGLTAVYSHGERVMSEVIFRVKFEFNKRLLEEVVERLRFEVGIEFDVVVSIPLCIYRRNWRGFNQAEVIAAEVGRQLGLPVLKALRRVKNNKQQSSLKSREERFFNVRGVFETMRVVRGERVLLVDDVFTSGATMGEACRTLKRAGARFVWGLVLARRV